jgi:hypothetical protein
MTAADKLTIIQPDRNEFTHEPRTRLKEKRLNQAHYDMLFYGDKNNFFPKEVNGDYGSEFDYYDEYGNEASDASQTPHDATSGNPFLKEPNSTKKNQSNASPTSSKWER